MGIGYYVEFKKLVELIERLVIAAEKLTKEKTN